MGTPYTVGFMKNLTYYPQIPYPWLYRYSVRKANPQYTHEKPYFWGDTGRMMMGGKYTPVHTTFMAASGFTCCGKHCIEQENINASLNVPPLHCMWVPSPPIMNLSPFTPAQGQCQAQPPCQCWFFWCHGWV